MDLAVSNALSDNLSVFIGLGAGTFASGVTYSVGHNPLALVAADLNGDGRMDLACVSFIGRDVSVLLGRGDGTFVTPDKFSEQRRQLDADAGRRHRRWRPRFDRLGPRWPDFAPSGAKERAGRVRRGADH